MYKTAETNINRLNPVLGFSVLAGAFLTGFFLYSASSAADSAIAALGISFSSLAVMRICVNCNLCPTAGAAAAVMFAFSPYMTQLAVINPFAAVIAAAGLWAILPWTSSLANNTAVFNLSFVKVMLPAVIFAVLFGFLANPQAMDALGLKTFFPLPVSEHPYPAFAKFAHIPYTNGIPVSAGYLMLAFLVPGLFYLSAEALMACVVFSLPAIACFDEAMFQIPPVIWAVYPMLAISIISANGINNLADFVEEKFSIRPVWVFFLPAAEILILAYIMTY